ncbi:hypothetical protein chiPu_0000552 [Chiloscyllium punctatum]|uniref:Uncharacterized protein n=1 Tax=Chiloscyllium punctatum TaxID=137246 RepID=A0A401RVI3_CHIPU|nr:hypothetical protein [Chiloscyllium punctatum]
MIQYIPDITVCYSLYDLDHHQTDMLSEEIEEREEASEEEDESKGSVMVQDEKTKKTRQYSVEALIDFQGD